MHESIKNLIKRIRKYNAKKRDVVLPAEAVRFDGDKLTLDGTPVRTTATADKHLCWISRIPSNIFLNKLTQEERATVFNRHYSENRKIPDMMYRMSGNTLYGVVSTSYRPLDNIVFIDIMRQAATACSELIMVKSILNPDHTKIRLVQGGGKVNELSGMIEMTNNECGMASLCIQAGVFRLVCANGLIIPTTNVQRSSWVHSGKHEIIIPDYGALLESAGAFIDKLDATKNIYLGAADKARILWDVSSALGQRVAAKVSEVANERYHGGRTMFDAVNSVTSAAQHFPPHQQTAIEQYAHRLIA